MIWALAWVGLAHAITVEEVFEDPLRSPDDLDTNESALSAEIGGNVVTGNTANTTIYARLDAAHRWDWNRVSLDVDTEIGRSIPDADGDGTLNEDERAGGYQKTAQEMAVDGRYDRLLTERDAIYGLGGWLHAPFSGYQVRTHGQLGFSRGLFDAGGHELRSELGFDVAHERFVEGVDPIQDMLYAARGFVGWTGVLADNVQVTETIESFVNVENPRDVRLISEAALSMSPNELFSVKASFRVEHDTEPVEGYRKTDQTIALTLVATLIEG